MNEQLAKILEQVHIARNQTVALIDTMLREQSVLLANAMTLLANEQTAVTTLHLPTGKPLSGEQAVYVGSPSASFHGDEPATIMGVRWITPPSNANSPAKPRLCFWLIYENGDEDFAPVTEALERGFVKMKDQKP